MNYQNIFNLIENIKIEIKRKILNLIKNNTLMSKNYENEKLKQGKDSIIIKYKIDKGIDKIKIFDKTFVRNNSENCKLIIENKIYDLIDYFYCDKIQNKENNILEIKLVGIQKITTAELMFKMCAR